MFELRAEDSIKKHAKSFSLAARFLPKTSFEDVCWLYALCRHIDDVADEGEPEQARFELHQLKTEILSESTNHSWAKLYQRLVQQRGLATQPMIDLIEGAESDLNQPCFTERKELLHYAYQVAGTVGWMMCPLIGVKEARAIPYAIDLGVAMQLTNICRDIKEDFERGRIYVDGLTKEDFDASALSEQKEKALVKVKAVLSTAEEFYDSGMRGCAFIPLMARLSIFIALCLYRGIGRKIAADKVDPFSKRSYLRPIEKIGAVTEGFWFWVKSFFAKGQKLSTPAIYRYDYLS